MLMRDAAMPSSHPLVQHRGVLGEDRDALLALEVHRVHDPVLDRPVVGLVRGNAPDCQSMASTSVVLPWSTCATMATLRRSGRLTRGRGVAEWTCENARSFWRGSRVRSVGRPLWAGDRAHRTKGDQARSPRLAGTKGSRVFDACVTHGRRRRRASRSHRDLVSSQTRASRSCVGGAHASRRSDGTKTHGQA